MPNLINEKEGIKKRSFASVGGRWKGKAVGCVKKGKDPAEANVASRVTWRGGDSASSVKKAPLTE